MKVDLEKIVAVIPETLGQELGIENRERLAKDRRSVVVCGLGGSGVTGDLLASLFPELEITTHKIFGLPRHFPSGSLFLVISYSGETEETLAAFEEALKNSLPQAVIAGGGTLWERAKAQNVPFVRVSYEKSFPTRFKVGSLLRASLEILEAAGLITRLESYLSPLAGFTPPSEGVALAQEISDKTVLLYAPDELVGLANFWKLALNETAKRPAYVNTIPEMLHNEIEAIDEISKPFLLLFDDPAVDERTRKRIGALETFARSRKWCYRVMRPENSARIVNLTSSLMLALETGLAIAELKNIDPTQTPFIEKLKQKY